MQKCALTAFLIVSCFSLLNGQTSSAKIFEAVRKNDLKEVQLLLDQKADPNSVDEDGDHLLMSAALYSSIECMQLLIEKGSNVNAKNKIDETPLMWSLHDPAKMKLLLQHGADVNAKPKTGNTPLLIASVGHGKYDAIKLLIDNGADPLAINNRKENALMRASLFGDTATIGLLLNKRIDINALSMDSSTALINAILNANKPVIFQLLDRGADPDMISFFGLTSLSFAVIFTDAESVKAILKKSKKVNSPDNDGNTVLMYAGYNEYDDVEMIQALIDNGAAINARSKNGATPLSWASKKGNTATVELLKKAGAK
jgi:ankyrin repeat protein